MKIVYFGAERVGLNCLKQLVDMRKNVIGVFTAHDDLRPKIADFVSFDEYLADLKVPYYKVKSSKSVQVIEQVKALSPSLVIVISWSQIIPKEIIECARLGCIGIHYSLLPARRGGAPLNWAIIDGLKKSGITLLYFDEGIDTGDIIAQKKFNITRKDTVKSLLDKILVLTSQIIAENIDLIERGVAPRRKQNNSCASYTSPRRPEDSEINWSLSPEELYNFIRALAAPYPNAFTRVGERRLIIPAARQKNSKLWIKGYIE